MVFYLNNLRNLKKITYLKMRLKSVPITVPDVSCDLKNKHIAIWRILVGPLFI